MESITNIETLELDEFAARFLPVLEARDAAKAAPTRYFAVCFERDGIYSVNIITAATGDNDLAAVTETAERHARHYGYRLANVEEKPEWYVNEHKIKGMPVYPIDEEAQRKYDMTAKAAQPDDDFSDVEGAQDTPDDYFIRNQETGKLELHFSKSTYDALDGDAKRKIKGAFLWGRRSGCWISRCKEPNLYHPISVAREIGLYDAGRTGERLTFAEQMERKAERAEHRAERYDARSDAAKKRGEALQKPISDMRGDTAFFTQPNINTSAGRAFTRRREKMFAAFDRGFEELRKSAYWQGRAETARATASQKELQNRGFVQRRIAERESSIRKVKKGIEEYEGFLDALDKGETPRDHHGWEVRLTPEQVQEQIEAWLDRLEALLDELGFYQDCMENLGGVEFSRDNIKVGYHVRYRGNRIGEVISRGPKNCTLRDIDSRFNYTPVVSYAEIDEIVKTGEAVEDAHPFRVGEEFTCSRWIPSQGRSVDCVYRIVKVTDKTVTLQTGDEKPFIRKPTKAPRDGGWEWWMRINDGYRGTITRKVGCNTK